MKKKPKLKLSEIKVESFITSMEGLKIEGRGTEAGTNGCGYTNNTGCGGNPTSASYPSTSPYPCSGSCPGEPGGGGSTYSGQVTCGNTCQDTCYMHHTCGGQGTCNCGWNQTVDSPTCNYGATCSYC